MSESPESTTAGARSSWRSLTRILTCLLLGLIALWIGLFLSWEYLPGTLSFDNCGYPHGTGTRQYFYKSGRLQLEEYYRAGLIVRGTWYRPDGAVLVRTEMSKKDGGAWYYLRDGGTIQSKMESQYNAESGSYDAEGTAVYYRPDGSIERTVQYHHGIPVESGAGSKK
jgi:hypothetical protein